MLRSKLISFAIIALVCASAATESFAKHESKVSVQVGKSVTESHSKIKVEFVEMVEDSRCPKDVNCVWAGNAKIKIKVTKGGKSKVLELNPNTPTTDSAFSGYSLKLEKLTPEPASNIRINRNGYVAVISMKKGS